MWLRAKSLHLTKVELIRAIYPSYRNWINTLDYYEENSDEQWVIKGSSWSKTQRKIYFIISKYSTSTLYCEASITNLSSIRGTSDPAVVNKRNITFIFSFFYLLYSINPLTTSSLLAVIRTVVTFHNSSSRLYSYTANP